MEKPFKTYSQQISILQNRFNHVLIKMGFPKNWKNDISLPTGLPQSTSIGEYCPSKLANSSWIYFLSATFTFSIIIFSFSVGVKNFVFSKIIAPLNNS